MQNLHAEELRLGALGKDCGAIWEKIGNAPSSPERSISTYWDLKRSRSTVEQLERYAKIENNIYWGKNIDDDIDFLRFVRLQDYIDAPKFLHGTEIYGQENYLAWRGADAYLNSIPVGDFFPSIELMSKTHEMATSALSQTLKKLDAVIPEGYLPSKGGVLKRRDSINIIPLTHPITRPLREAEYLAVKNNPWLEGFIELPAPISAPEKRRGWIQYAKSQDTEVKLNQLMDWYSKNKDSMDPVELAGRFQYRFVSIHPFIDGNGRAGRLIMDRILAEYGIAPPILLDSWEDVLLGEDKFVEQVREGVDRFLTLAESKDYANAEGIRRSTPGSLAILTVPKSLPQKFFLREVKIGDKEFFFQTADGFFYDRFAVPHAMEGNTLYPIADRTYRLLEMNTMRKGTVPGMSKAHALLVQKNLRFLKAVEAGEVKLADISLAPYEAIAKANKEGRLYLYPWQKQAFADAIVIEKTNPGEILRPFRYAKTDFDMYYDVHGHKPSQILAQYELVDLLYSELQGGAQKFFPDLFDEVINSRRKIHTAARQLLKEYQDARNALPAEVQLQVGNYYKVKLFDEYLAASKLTYENFDTAIRDMGDDTLVLMRSDGTAVNKFGFVSDSDFMNLFKKLPNSNKLAALIDRLKTFLTGDGGAKTKQMLALIKERADKGLGFFRFLPKSIRSMTAELEPTYNTIVGAVDQLVATTLQSPYALRGVGNEYERAFVLGTLHAKDQGSKIYKSFTTSTVMMQEFPFVYGNIPPQISFVKFNKKDVLLNLADDGYIGEYEVFAKGYIPPTRIKKALNKSDLAPPLQDINSLDPSSPVRLFFEKYFAD